MISYMIALILTIIFFVAGIIFTFLAFKKEKRKKGNGKITDIGSRRKKRKEVK